MAPQATGNERLVPREWVAAGVPRLEQNRPPHDVARHRWRQFVEDCNAFLNSPEAEKKTKRGRSQDRKRVAGGEDYARGTDCVGSGASPIAC